MDFISPSRYVCQKLHKLNGMIKVFKSLLKTSRQLTQLEKVR